MKVLYPTVTGTGMGKRYRKDYLSVAFPGVPVSKNAVSEAYKQVGLNRDGRRAFYDLMLSDITESDVLYVDGTLVQDTSKVNSLSAHSYKSHQTGHKVISVISCMAAKNDMFCCEDVVPGSYSDTGAFRNFLITGKITSGIIVGDTAFCPSIVRSVKEEMNLPDLHFILRLRKNDTRIKAYNLLTGDVCFESSRGDVVYKKVKLSDSCYLYSFKNDDIENMQKNLLLKSLRIKKYQSKNMKSLKNTLAIYS